MRGILSRVRTQMALRSKLDDRQLSIFHYMCIQLQKRFRGYYSRKYKQDQMRRNRYKERLQQLGQETLKRSEQYREDLTAYEQQEADRKQRENFVNLGKGLHHLLSTKHVRGTYNPHHEYLPTPTMDGVPVEEHIRAVVKDLLRTRGVAKKGGLITDINGTKKIPFKGLKYRLSLQASAPYNILEEDKRRTRVLHKILTNQIGGKRVFFAGGTTNVINKNEVPMSVGDPYLDPWANPMLVKGVPENQKQLLESTRTHKALFVKHIEKPFVSSVGGNRSTALPNDVFDVIKEAEETGGAIQRQKGTQTVRFGLSQNTDNRYDGGIPALPVRATMNVKSTKASFKKLGIHVKANKTAPNQDSYGDNELFEDDDHMSPLRMGGPTAEDSSSDEDGI